MNKLLILPFVALFTIAVAGCAAQSTAYSSTLQKRAAMTSTVVSQGSTDQAATVEYVRVNPTRTPEVKTTAAPTKPISAASLPCNQAAPAPLFDVTIPDDTILAPGEVFSKTWRFVNQGSCTWTRKYALVWFSGDDFKAGHEQVFLQNVDPGQLADLSVDMVAPVKAGSYWSYWMLQSDDGKLFGIGPDGTSPFWVRIQVVELNTPTPSQTAVPTATPVVLIESQINMASGQIIDLDSGTLSTGTDGDLAFQVAEDGSFAFGASNGARQAHAGENQPSETDCLQASYQDPTMLLSELPVPDHFCFRTNQGLPGYYEVTGYDPQTGTAVIQFVTWAIP